MEAEELRYEKEVLEWKLQEAAGSRYAPHFLTPTTLWTGQQAGIGPQPAFNGTIERAIQAKHVSIYPTMSEVCWSVRQNILYRVTTRLENLEKSGNLGVVRERSGTIGKVRENVFLHVVYHREYCWSLC